MASQLLGIKTRFTNDLGSPLVGGQVYTYFAGTSTNQDSYSDAALTVPNTNPVILDDTGSADIFLKGAYRIRVFDKSGRFIEEQDNVTQAASQGDATELTNKVGAIKNELDAQKLDTGITATAKFGGVERTQSDKNAETVSLLDFGAPYSTDSTLQLQNALNYLNSVGGGVLRIPYHTGVLVLSGAITGYSNITVKCDPNLVIDSNTTAASYLISVTGSLASTEYKLTQNATVGDTQLSFASGLAVSPLDHLLLVSQRECAHADAGADWLLGETTGNVSSPFFAEVVTVSKSVSQGNIEIQNPLMFPDYRVDNTLETSQFARDSSTLQKINFVESFHWQGGIFKKESGSIFNLSWCKKCSVDASFERGYGIGQEVLSRYSYANTIRAKVTRPADWVMQENHQRYNSIKDISSWYTNVILDEENGSQGLDQTYAEYPCIYPVYNITARGAKEAAMTTHGNCYGADIIINAANCGNYALYNRARFVTAKVKAINCYGAVSCSVAGALDCSYDLDATNMYHIGIRLDSKGTALSTPAKKNTQISGRILMSPKAANAAVLLEANLDADNLLVDSGILLSNLRIRSTYRAIGIYENVNGVTFDNVVVDFHGTVIPIYLRYNAGHSFSNFRANMVNNYGTVISCNVLADVNARVAYGVTPLSIDYNTCKVVNGELLNNDIRLVAQSITLAGTSETASIYTIQNKNTTGMYVLNVTKGVDGENRIAFENSIPMGAVLKFSVSGATGTSFGLYPPNGGTITFLTGALDAAPRFVSSSAPSMLYVQKIGDNNFIAYR